MTLRRVLILFCYSSSAYNNTLPANAARSLPLFITSSSTTSFGGLTNLKTTPTRIQNFSRLDKYSSPSSLRKSEYPEPIIMPEQGMDEHDDDDDDRRPTDERASNDDDVVDDGAGAAEAAHTAVVACAASEDGRDDAAKGWSVVRFFSASEEIHHATSRWGDDSWQIKSLRFITSHKVQLFFVCLLLLDVLILFAELVLDTTFPECYKIVQNAVSCCPIQGDEIHAEAGFHRILEGDGDVSTDHSICTFPLVDTGHDAGCDEHKYSGVHSAHEALYWITVSILVTFEVELLFLIYLLGPVKFMQSIMYILDFIIVSVSLALELVLHFIGRESAAEVLPGLLIIFRLWRFVRIGHGLVASAHEVGSKKMEVALEHLDKLEEILITNGIKVPERPKI